MGASEFDLTPWTAEIVSAYVAHNVIGREKLPDFIGAVHAALSKASMQGIEPAMEGLKPAVPIKKSVTQEFIPLKERRHCERAARQERTPNRVAIGRVRGVAWC